VLAFASEMLVATVLTTFPFRPTTFVITNCVFRVLGSADGEGIRQEAADAVDGVGHARVERQPTASEPS